ncbi:MAG: NUDIX domain-containing protein [Bacteroidetes bacterium]|nr:NUDIX domain-containing protein [Bacteroidota bacterium]
MEGFNVRVYGVWIHDQRLLVNEEIIKGKKMIKFPGGGLHFGEGTIDCLKREFREELGLDIDVQEHFYTTDFFQPSAFDNSQVISIYYLVGGDIPVEIVNHIPNERTYWMELGTLNADTFSLPIDRIVGDKLHKLFVSKKI